MEGGKGILEVFLVSAEGIKHKNIIGKPTYHVIVECGTQVCRSKSSSGDHERRIFWNEKFTFELLLSKNLPRLRLKIINEEYFTDGAFSGETIICLKGIVTEGYDRRGFIELMPVPYSVVLDDDSYIGQIKVGLKYKFISNKVPQTERRKETTAEEKVHWLSTIWTAITNLRKIQWWRWFFFNGNNKFCPDEQKHN